MSEENTVALTAMIISLVALLIALVQLLQQVFGTADGYRKCQDSVVRPWSKYTKLSRRWKEFRLESTFRTPGITFVEIPENHPSLKDDLDRGTGLLAQLSYTFQSGGRTPDMVTWISLLEQTYLQEQKAMSVYAGFGLKSQRIPLPRRTIVNASAYTLSGLRQ